MITVAIPTKDRPEKLTATLTGLLYQIGPSVDFRVLIRDEGSVSAMESRAVRQVAELLARGVRVNHFRREPVGLVLARKDMLEMVDTDYLLWLDDDIILGSTALFRFRRLFEEGQGFTCPIIVDVDNVRGYSNYTHQPVSKETWLCMGMEKHYIPCDEPMRHQVFRGNGGCMFLKTEVARGVAKYDFDHITRGEGEDMIASLRIADKYKCWLDTGIIAHHLADAVQQWNWAGATGSLMLEFLAHEISSETMRKAEIPTLV